MDPGTDSNGRSDATAPGCGASAPVTVASDTVAARVGTTTTGANRGPQQYAHSHAVLNTLKHAMHGLP